MRNRLPMERVSMAVLTLAALTTLAPNVRAQSAPAPAVVDPNVIYACYIPTFGTVYRIKTSDTREKCASASHVMFSFNETGPQGPAGPQGPGPAGTGRSRRRDGSAGPSGTPRVRRGPPGPAATAPPLTSSPSWRMALPDRALSRSTCPQGRMS